MGGWSDISLFPASVCRRLQVGIHRFVGKFSVFFRRGSVARLFIEELVNAVKTELFFKSEGFTRDRIQESFGFRKTLRDGVEVGDFESRGEFFFMSGVGAVNDGLVMFIEFLSNVGGFSGGFPRWFKFVGRFFLRSGSFGLGGFAEDKEKCDANAQQQNNAGDE